MSTLKVNLMSGILMNGIIKDFKMPNVILLSFIAPYKGPI